MQIFFFFPVIQLKSWNYRLITCKVTYFKPLFVIILMIVAYNLWKPFHNFQILNLGFLYL